MKKLYCLIFTLFFLSITGYCQIAEWAKIFPQFYQGTAGIHSGGNIVLEPSGNDFVVANTFMDSVVIDNQVFRNHDSLLFPYPEGYSDIYLTKYSSAGAAIWAKHIYSHKPDKLVSMTTDQNGNIYLCGIFIDSLLIDNTVLRNSFTTSAASFIAKFNATGNLLWAHPIALNASGKLAADNSGNIYVSGLFHNNLTLDTITISENGRGDIFLTKYNSTGNFEWIKVIGGPGYEMEGSVTATSAGDVFLVGSVDTSAQIENQPINTAGMIFAKFNTSGNLLWHKHVPNLQINIQDIDLDNSNNIILSGEYWDSVSFGSTHFPPARGYHNFIAKADMNGSWLWASKISSTHGAPNVTIDNQNNLFLFGNFINTIEINNIPFPKPNATSLTYLLVKFNSSGNILWTKPYSNTFNQQVFGIDMTTTAYGNLFIAGSFQSPIYLDSVLLSPPPLDWSYRGSFLVKFSTDLNAAIGKVYVDKNNNSVFDSSDQAYPEIILQSDPTRTFGVSDNSGDYSVFCPIGNSDITISDIPKYYTASPAKHSISFNGAYQQLTGNDFALVPIPNQNDIQISVTPNSFRARPGFPYSYRITYQNVGTTTLSGNITLQHDAILNYDSASVSTTSIQNNVLTWTYQNLNPLEKRSLNIYYTIPSTVIQGTTLQCIASAPLSNDVFITNNYDTVNHVVTASFDPNDKQVKQKTLTLNQLAADNYLDYTIRFQNTGNDTAFTVVLEDFMPENLKLATLQMVSASHPYALRIGKNRKVEWVFDNILLPDSGTNELLSHGFVRFRIKPNTDLKAGDSISNSAAIYFDYNMPVNTNNAVTRIISLPGKNSQIFKNFIVYPNPTASTVTIATELEYAGVVTLKLLNVLDQEILSQEIHTENYINHNLDISAYSQGMYIIQLQAGDKQISERVFKR